MPIVTMPNGDRVNMPDNPTADQLAGLKRVANQQVMTMVQQRAANPTPGDILTGQSGSPLGLTKAQQDKLANASTGEKLALNFGAGANSILQGARQVLGGGETPDEAIQRTNQQNALAASVPGGRAAQIAGKMAMTAPVNALPIGSGLLGAGVGLATQGAAMGALEPAATPGQRLANMGVGAAAAPALGGALNVAGRLATPVVNFLNPKAAATKILQGAVGDDAPAVVNALRNAPPTTGDLSVAAITGHPGLQAVEAQSRAHPSTQAGWNVFDSAGNSARSDVLQNLGGDTAAAIKKAVEERAATIQPQLDAALDAANAPRSVYNLTAPDYSNQIGNALAKVRPTSDIGKAIVGDLRSDAAGSSPVSANDLHVAYTELNKPAASAVDDAGIGAAKDAIRGVLDNASGGKYGTYLKAFEDASGPVNAAEQLNAVKGSHWLDTADGQFPAGSARGPNPTVNPGTLVDALRGQAAGKWGLQLNAGDRDIINSLIQEQYAADAAKAGGAAAADPTGTVGGTLGEAAAQIGAHALGGFPGAALVKPVLALGGSRTQQALASMLRDPGETISALQGTAMGNVLPDVARFMGTTGAIQFPGAAAQAQQQYGPDPVLQAIQ